MSTFTSTVSTAKGSSAFIKSHPLISYFFLAYAGMWIVISPLVMDSFGWIELSDGWSLLLFVLSSLSGPALAAFWVTGVLEGKAGMTRLLRRTFQVRAGLQWYAVVLFIFLAIWLIAYSFLYAGAPIRSLIANPSLFVSAFLPSVIMGLIIPSIGEEPGWRGFALPRMQAAYGPVTATVILGTLHGVWHLPALFTPLLGPFTLQGFTVFVLTAAAGTFIYTWVFNNTRGSVWMAMVLHASSNAASQLVSSLIPEDAALTGWRNVLASGWINVIVFSAVAVLLVLLTRGTLGYSGEKEIRA
ncbi:MAG TPA: type II CAAX endopeptidase family protein [Anaerolineales bacterium]|nr:type II CAAX endopeptidase family protein [Anaerolineales bacterium]